MEKQQFVVSLYSGSGEYIVAKPEWQKTLLTAHAVPHTEDDVVPVQQPSQVLCLAVPSPLIQSARRFVKDLAQEADGFWGFMPAQKKGLQRIKWSSRHCDRTHPPCLEDLQCYDP